MLNLSARMILGPLCLLAALAVACSHEAPAVKPVQMLPSEKLALYNDSFDSLRSDLWEKIGFIRGATVRSNFRQADVSTENGRLKVETKTGDYSSSGISSKFCFRGDFDVQVDCDIQFLQEAGTMDQLIYFLASDITAELEDSKLENVVLELDKEGTGDAYIMGFSLRQGKRERCYIRKLGDRFMGSLRIARSGNQIRLMVAAAPGGEWQPVCAYYRPVHDTRINLGVRNFFERRVSIQADWPLVVHFDNFRVNSAQEIIESEI
jgi:hypothetical protein